MAVAKRSDRRWLPLLLLLLPFLCAGIAYAARLQISSPYFTVRFGPPDVSATGDNTVGDTSVLWICLPPEEEMTFL